MPQSLSRVLIHIVFSTKDRTPFLKEPVRRELYPYLGAVLTKNKCVPIQIGGELAAEIDRPEMSTGIGLVKFALECSEDEFATAAGASNWKERIRTFWSLLSGKA